ncbi:Thioredoxin reductase [Luteitalea pratensis]|uniref:Thioredoxin reductase n=1 Tax=Luteitalea pratensis TaxID=1855912 RepID=A0A143PPI6_LUTPR|nr:thioredoxin-disulfide reductase [Luteitalea pratensis]AMY10617.1 Thioredoxin reductase [Luteitalea pratensis]
MSDDVRNVVIIGSGPAGLTAALYTARASLHPLVIEGLQPGGQLTITTMVENWPGHRDGVMGPQLMADMRAQAEHFGTAFLTGLVERVDFSSRPFALTLDSGQVLRAKTVIVATGATAKLLGLPSEMKLMGRGVSTCATCDGFFFRNRPVAIVGGGDTALEEAIYLSKLASHVTVIHRRDTLRASKIMQDKAFQSPKISFRWNTAVDEILSDERGDVNRARLRNLQTGEVDELSVDGVFVAIGHTPNTQLFKGHLNMDEGGYLITNGTRTNVDGVFAAGDVQDQVYRQAITSAGTGCMAAMDAERWLELGDSEYHHDGESASVAASASA